MTISVKERVKELKSDIESDLAMMLSHKAKADEFTRLYNERVRSFGIKLHELSLLAEKSPDAV